MGGLKKVKAGEPVRFGAKTWNAFIDAAEDFKNRTGGPGQRAELSSRESGIVLVRNDTEAVQERFAILGINPPVILPTEDELEYQNQVVISGVVPLIGPHDGKFVILAEPLSEGAIGRAYIDGVCPVKIQSSGIASEVLADHMGLTTHLCVYANGGATILWQEEGGGAKVRWAFVRLGRPQPLYVWPVNLTQVGGAQGTSIAPATWTYDVYDVLSGVKLLANVSPVTAPHRCKRPNVGQLGAANFGFAYQDMYGLTLLAFVNEVPQQEACD